MKPRAHHAILSLLKHRHIVAPLLLLLALWLPGATQGWFRTDAPVYAALSLNTYLRPLAESWSPAFGVEPYFNKPPLAFYIHGLSLYILGPTILAARLPALLVASAIVATTALHAKSLTNKRTALLAALILASSLEFFRYTKTISLDLLLTLCLTAFVALIARSNARTRHIYLAALPLGLALLTKPFVALLAVPPIALWLISQKNHRAIPHFFASTLLACAVAAPWHIAMYLKHGQPFLNEYIGSQALDRITTSAHGASPWHHYLQILAESYWPWLIPFALACIAFTRKRTPTKDKPAVTLALIWCAFWFVALSISTDKSGRYLVPIYPLAAIACATWLASFFNRAQLNTIHRRAIPVTAAFAILAFASNFIPSFIVHKPIAPNKQSLYTFLRAHTDTDLRCVPPGAKALASEIFLATNTWPTFIADDAPQRPAIFIHKTKSKSDPPPDSTIIFQNPTYTVRSLSK